MKKLSEDFQLSKYGITCRLVRPCDAEFIVSLRTNPKLSKHIHATSDDTKQQLEWLKAYKQREQEGRDYYFIYAHDNELVGVNRVYDIDGEYGTAGSWVCRPNTDPEISVATLLILRDIMFEELGLRFDKFDVRKGNKQVQRIHKMMGAKIVDESEIDYYFILDKNEYIVKRDSIIALLNL